MEWGLMEKNGIEMLTGEFSVTLDDAGRISLPKRLREILDIDKVWVTRGIDRCLCLYTIEQYDELRKKIINKIKNQYSADAISLRRRILGAQDLDVDKQGRILLPPMLREWAGLFKNCVVLAQSDYIEILAEDNYRTYLNTSEDNFRIGLEKLGSVTTEEKGDDDTGNSHSGAAGGNDSVSGAEGRG
jgi:MraZ protein